MRVFLSHSSRNKPLLREIIGYFPPFIAALLDEEQLAPGDPIETTIRENIDNADYVVLFIDTEAVASNWVQLEIDYAIEVERRSDRPILVPIVIDKEAWQHLQPESLRNRLFLEWKGPSRTDVRNLADQIWLNLCALQSRELERYRNLQRDNIHHARGKPIPALYHESAYDVLGEWYDRWYDSHWKSDDNFRIVTGLIAEIEQVELETLRQWRVLDCACGSGNTYIAFRQAEFTNAFGSDGSWRMLECARRNCEIVGVSTDHLIQKPIRWTDFEAFARYFPESTLDLIVNTANSLCHIPPTADYLGRALAVFHRLLKPGGYLVVDTKRYTAVAPRKNGEPIRSHRELRYSNGDWLVRDERVDISQLPDLGTVYFHSKLHHDMDYAFGTPVERTLIVVTICGEKVPPRTFTIPYYPLPATVLVAWMRDAGFEPSVYDADPTLKPQRKYDVVVAKKL
jgi:SAM-dependent methyltransferase